MNSCAVFVVPMLALTAIAGVFLDRAALIIGLLAGPMAIGAFLGRAYAALRRRGETEIQIQTAIGGLVGLLAASVAIIVDFIEE